MTGSQLKITRQRLGLSLVALGRLIRINYRTIHRWERGEYAIPYAQQLKCALAFHLEARREAGWVPCPQCNGAGLVVPDMPSTRTEKSA